MKRLILALLCFLAVLAMASYGYAVHARSSRAKNTRYSQHFSDETFSRVTFGMHQDAVIALLSPPLERAINQYEVWALRNSAAREHYANQSTVPVVTLFFTYPLDPHRDYNLA